MEGGGGTERKEGRRMVVRDKQAGGGNGWFPLDVVKDRRGSGRRGLIGKWPLVLVALYLRLTTQKPVNGPVLNRRVWSAEAERGPRQVHAPLVHASHGRFNPASFVDFHGGYRSSVPPPHKQRRPVTCQRREMAHAWTLVVWTVGRRCSKHTGPGSGTLAPCPPPLAMTDVIVT